LALEAEVSRLRHHISVMSRPLHLSSLESESLRRELDALCSVAPLSGEGDGSKASPLREEVADEVPYTPRWLCLRPLRWRPSARMWRH